MEALQRVKQAGYDVVIAQLEVELDLLRRAGRYPIAPIRCLAMNGASPTKDIEEECF
jgi:hypothetical protein